MVRHFLALVLTCACAVPVRAQPNIVVICTDDVGYNELGYTGDNPFRTPAIDSIAAGGIRMRAGYVTEPICAPSRAGLMLGMHGQRFGFENNHENNIHSTDGLQPGQLTLGHRLQAMGYTTGVVGKWHLGAMDGWNRPLDMGFDEFYGILSGARSYWRGETLPSKKMMRQNLAIEDLWAQEGDPALYDPVRGRYVTDAFGEEAAAFIDRHASDGAPFFLFLPFTAPHEPYEAKSQDLAEFPDLEGELKIRAAMVFALDRAVGMVLEALDSNGIADETIVVFLNDNGGRFNQDNSPFRGYKGDTFEGGIRVPFCVRWPGMPQNVDYDAPVSSLDLVPTLVAAAGGTVDQTDGVDLRDYLTGDNPGDPHQVLDFRFLEAWAISRAGWKLVKPERADPQVYLFDLEHDPFESIDRLSGEPVVADVLLREFSAWESTLDKPRWRSGGGTNGINPFDHFRFAAASPSAVWSEPEAWFREDSDEPATMVPYDAYANAVLEFPGSASSYVALNDMERMSGETFMLHEVRFSGASGPGYPTTATIAGNPLLMVPDRSGIAARLSLEAASGDYSFRADNDIEFLGTLVLGGDGGAALLLTGDIREYLPGQLVRKTGDSSIELRGLIECSKDLRIERGTLRCAGPRARLDSAGAIRLRPSASLFLGRGSIAAAATLTHEGHLEGDGELTIHGGYAAGPHAVLALDVAGHQPGIDHDQLVAVGPASMGGELRVTLGPGFEPAPGDSFRIVEAAVVQGQFERVTGSEPGPGMGYRTEYSSTGVTLRVVCTADLDGDGTTDTVDFLAFLNAWAAGEPLSDWNGDGRINTADFIAYLNDWSSCRSS